jgi:hypothetical protein
MAKEHFSTVFLKHNRIAANVAKLPELMDATQ